MKKKIFQTTGFIVLLSGLFALTACNNQGNSESSNTDTTKSGTSMREAEATVSGVFPDTTVNGTVKFTQQSDGKVKMDLQLMIPAKANKSVAVHIHENAECGDMGKAAGGHWNPTNEMHGKWGSDHFHSGDIGNISLDADGKGSLMLESDRWSIGGDSKTDILNRTIIVHGGMDDYTSQPSGNSGVRIGCGTIKETTTKM